MLCCTKEQVSPPPKSASRFQSSERGKGRLGAMSSKGAKRIGMQPPACSGDRGRLRPRVSVRSRVRVRVRVGVRVRDRVRVKSSGIRG